MAGPDALAQIIEASRRSDSLPGPTYSQSFQKPLGNLPGPAPRSLEGWGAVAGRDAGSMQQIDSGEPIGFAHPPFFAGHTSMRYQGY